MPFNKKVDANAVLARVLQEGPDGLLTRGEASVLISSRPAVRDGRDNDAIARNRVGMMLDRACKRGGYPSQGGLTRRPDWYYTVDQIAHWAEFKFPGMFPDLPRRPSVILLSIQDSFSAGDASEGEGLPGNIAECHALIQSLRNTARQDLAERFLAAARHKRMLVDNFNGKKEK